MRLSTLRGMKCRALLVLIAMFGASTAGVAVAEGERYVALGDSYSAGTGAGGHYGSCYRSRKAYPRLWAQANQPASFAFAACGGATTDTVIAKQVNALADDTTLVTITIGGNDVGFGSVMRTCTLGSDRACLDRVAQGVAATEQVLPAKLDAAYRAIEERAPRARVVVLGYPHLFAHGPTSCGMSLTKRTALNAAADKLNAVIAARAGAAGLRFEPVTDDFAGHGVCTSRPWINGVVLFPVIASYHPNAEGQRHGYLRALTGAVASTRPA
ncbi:SGNH family lipase [Actinokineospora soli]